jgi:hypothetical protein
MHEMSCDEHFSCTEVSSITLFIVNVGDGTNGNGKYRTKQWLITDQITAVHCYIIYQPIEQQATRWPTIPQDKWITMAHRVFQSA